MVSGFSKLALVLGLGVFVVSGCGGGGDAGADGAADAGDPMAMAGDYMTGAGLPNPNPNVIKGWGPLPGDREWGATAGVDIDPIDGHVWAYDRCGALGLQGGCGENLVDPVLKFDRNTGEVLAAFGAGEFELPHGIHVDDDGNVWIADMNGHHVVKFSPEGEVLLRLGTRGEPGSDTEHFNLPNDVFTAADGSIFVADGHQGQFMTTEEAMAAGRAEGHNGRIMKFSPDGEFIMEWGQIGTEPGNFRTPHALEMDSQGRLFVADRGNHRIQIFDQEGNLLDTYEQYSRISGLFITDDDMLYAIDSETNGDNHTGWHTGIRVGSAMEDRVTAFVPPHPTENPWGAAGEGVAVDPDGNVYAAEGPISRQTAEGGLTKYSR